MFDILSPILYIQYIGEGMKLNQIRTIPVQIPHREIFARLKYNRHKTKVDAVQAGHIDDMVAQAFEICAPAGVWIRVPVQERTTDTTTLENGLVLRSTRLTELLFKSTDVLFMAATVGEEVVAATVAAVTAAQGSRAVIYDAVGSETADASLNWINEYVRHQIARFGEHLTKRRFSPGYGDLGLEHQAAIHTLLQLETIGITISPRYQLSPEKSVIGIAGIERG